MTQSDNILQALKNGDVLTPLEALNRFGCFRLSGRIWDLRSEGHDIRSEIVSRDGKHYSKYWLVTKQEANGQLTLV